MEQIELISSIITELPKGWPIPDNGRYAGKYTT